MSDILLGGILAEKVALLTPNEDSRLVKLHDYGLSEDLYGMPVLCTSKNESAKVTLLSNLQTADYESLKKLKDAYGLVEKEVQYIDDNAQKTANIWLSDRGNVQRGLEAEDILTAVLNAPNAKVAKATVIGGGYREAAYELAKNEHRELAYTHRGQTSDIPSLEVESLETGFYKFERLRYKHQRFDGEISNEITREVLTSGDAVVLLPYDPVLDQIVLIEQMRPAALARHSLDAWGLEAVAGVIGYGEAPEYTAERELEEEAGLELKGLYPLAPCYQSPGTVSQMMYLYVAGVDLSDYQAGIFGLASEDEDIRSLILSREEGLALLRTGEANNAPLQILLYALALNHQEIAQDLLAARGNPA